MVPIVIADNTSVFRIPCEEISAEMLCVSDVAFDDDLRKTQIEVI